jgi:hypothetical protein
MRSNRDRFINHINRNAATELSKYRLFMNERTACQNEGASGSDQPKFFFKTFIGRLAEINPLQLAASIGKRLRPISSSIFPNLTLSACPSAPRQIHRMR